MCLQTWSEMLLSSLCFDIQFPGTLQTTNSWYITRFYLQIWQVSYSFALNWQWSVRIKKIGFSKRSQLVYWDNEQVSVVRFDGLIERKCKSFPQRQMRCPKWAGIRKVRFDYLSPYVNKKTQQPSLLEPWRYSDWQLGIASQPTANRGDRSALAAGRRIY